MRPDRSRLISLSLAMSAVLSALLCAQAVSSPPAMTMHQAVELAFARNRDVLAARLEVQDKLVDELVASLWQNPQLSYNIQNLVWGRGNNQQENIHPTFFNQRQEGYGLQQVFDVWRKRHKRLAVAKQETLLSRLQVEDVLRELAFQVRSRFADVVRAQEEEALVGETREGYAQTVDLMRRREAAGDIARSDLDKVELEALRYEQQARQASLQLGQARQALAELLAFGDALSLPPQLEAPQFAVANELDPGTEGLVGQAMQQRPDVRAAEAERVAAYLSIEQAQREAYPDLQLALTYNNSHFVIGGDNPHTLQLTATIDLPVFDRNEGGRGHAAARKGLADNALVALKLGVESEVRSRALQWQRSGESLKLFEQGGMLERAQRAKDVAKRSFAAGATSLLELLEAERTRLTTQADYLTTLNAWRQAHIAVAHAAGQTTSSQGGM